MAVPSRHPESSPGPVVLETPDIRAGDRRRTGSEPAFDVLAQRVRSEYREMPGLNLTREQAQCLWNLAPEACDRILSHLVKAGFLTRTVRDTYVRADAN